MKHRRASAEQNSNSSGLYASCPAIAVARSSTANRSSVSNRSSAWSGTHPESSSARSSRSRTMAASSERLIRSFRACRFGHMLCARSMTGPRTSLATTNRAASRPTSLGLPHGSTSARRTSSGYPFAFGMAGAPFMHSQQRLGFVGLADFERALEDIQRLERGTLEDIDPCEIVVRLDKIRLGCKCALMRLKRRVVSSQGEQCDAEIVMGLGQTGHARQGVPEGLDSLIEVALAHQRYAEIVADLGMVGLERDGLAIVRDGLLDVSLFGQRLAQVHISFDQVRTKRDGGAIAAFGFDVFSLRREDDAEIVARLGEIGLECKRPLVGLRGLVQPRPLGKYVGPIVMRLHGSGIERDHALVAGERHIGLALFPDGVAEVHVGVGIVRLECDGLAIARDGVFHATEGVQRQAQVVLPLRNIVVQGDRFADHVGGDVGPPDLNPDQPGVVQGADVLGLDSQDVTIEAVRISELAGLMMLYCLREQPIDVRVAIF